MRLTVSLNFWILTFVFLFSLSAKAQDKGSVLVKLYYFSNYDYFEEVLAPSEEFFIAPSEDDTGYNVNFSLGYVMKSDKRLNPFVRAGLVFSSQDNFRTSVGDSTYLVVNDTYTGRAWYGELGLMSIANELVNKNIYINLASSIGVRKNTANRQMFRNEYYDEEDNYLRGLDFVYERELPLSPYLNVETGCGYLFAKKFGLGLDLNGQVRFDFFNGTTSRTRTVFGLDQQIIDQTIVAAREKRVRLHTTFSMSLSFFYHI